MEDAKMMIVQRVTDCANYLRKRRPDNEISFIVVTGNHSHTNACESRNLQISVKNYLNKNKVAFKGTDNRAEIRVFVNRNTSIQ